MLLIDLKYAYRSWRRSSGLALAVVSLIALTGALCICAFTVTDALLWHSLSYSDPQRLLMIWRAVPAGVDVGSDVLPWGAAEYAQLHDSVKSFESTAAFKPAAVTLSGRGLPKRLDAAWVTPQLFATLGVSPYLGRWFQADGAASITDRQSIILGYDLWRSEFHRDVHVIGTQVTMDGKPYIVIGVAGKALSFPRNVEMPRSFHAAVSTQVWMLLPLELEQPGAAELAVVGRMKPGVTLPALTSSLGLLSAEEDRMFPQAKGWHKSVPVALTEAVHGPLRKPLFLLTAAVSSTLLISLCNISGLMLSKQVTRRGDFALRAAMGAARSQLVRASLTDSLALALIGGLAGMAMAAVAVTAIRDMAGAEVPLLLQMEFNWRIALFSVFVFIIFGVVLGLFSTLSPALSAPSSLLRGGLRGGNDVSTARIRSIITIVEISLSISLLAGAAMAWKTIASVVDRYPGFSTDSVLTAQVNLPPGRYRAQSPAVQFYRGLIAQLSSVPAVASVSIAEVLPLKGDPEGTVFQLERQQAAHPNEMPTANYSVISPMYFRTLNARLVRGREFSEEDTLSAAPVAIVNSAMANKYWPNGDFLGKQIVIPGAGLKMTIVGQIADLKHRSLTETAVPEMFVPFTQKVWTPLSDMQVAIKYKGTPEPVIAQLRETVSRLDPEVPVSKIETLEVLKQDSLREMRLIMDLLAAFAAASMLISAAGVNAIILENVRTRNREFAIRLALGSPRSSIIGTAILEASVMVAAGLVVGLLGSYVTFKAISHLMPDTIGLGFSWVLLVIATGLFTSGIAAVWPCLIAVKVQPARVLREA